jgi:hypothetical protein
MPVANSHILKNLECVNNTTTAVPPSTETNIVTQLALTWFMCFNPRHFLHAPSFVSVSAFYSFVVLYLSLFIT